MKVAPNISREAGEFYRQTFATVNRGVTYALEVFPQLFGRAAEALRGRFKLAELWVIVDATRAGQAPTWPAGLTLSVRLRDAILTAGLDAKHDIDAAALVHKVDALTDLESLALEVWCDKYHRAGVEDAAQMAQDMADGLRRCAGKKIRT